MIAVGDINKVNIYSSGRRVARNLTKSGEPKWVVEREVDSSSATHCFSVCLYYEPEYKRFFPKRDFNKRYLDKKDEVKEIFKKNGYHLKIFTDDTMLETALGFDFASVYKVTTPHRFPFCQHIWRYYAVLLDDKFPCYHFRGLDNLSVTEREAKLLQDFLDSGMDLFHCPYSPPRCKYLPIRGSCGVSKNGAESLANYLLTVRNTEQFAHTAKWHNDEHYLAEWYHRNKLELKLFTVLDREQCKNWHSELDLLIRAGKEMHIVRPIGIPWMRVKKHQANG